MTTLATVSLSDVGRKRAKNQDRCAVHSAGRAQPELSEMGTTAVLLFIPSVALGWVAHVGDSRAYRIRKGCAERLTADHSLVAQLLRLGEITLAEADSVPKNVLTRAVGREPTVEAEINRISVEGGDRFLLCSDGLWNIVSDEEIAEIVGCQPPDAAIRHLVDLANERGAPDNVTVQVAALSDDENEDTAQSKESDPRATTVKSQPPLTVLRSRRIGLRALLLTTFSILFVCAAAALIFETRCDGGAAQGGRALRHTDTRHES